MSDTGTRRSHGRKRFRASRSFRFLLLSLGLTALILGICLLAYGHMIQNVRIASFAAGYCVVGAMILGLRQAMLFAHELRKKKQAQVRKLHRGLRPAVEHPKLDRSR